MRIDKSIVLAASIFAFWLSAERSNARELESVEGGGEIAASSQLAMGLDPTIVEIDDRFILAQSRKADAKRLDLVILDGIRKSYPEDCKSPGPVPGIGVPRETRLSFEYQHNEEDGRLHFVVSRTLDFNGYMRNYRFSVKRGDILVLDKGVLVSLDSDGVLSYEQVAQPIGPVGKKSMSVRFEASNDDFGSTMVEIESDRWEFSKVEKSRRGDIVVNGVSVPSGGSSSVAAVRNEAFYSIEEFRLRSMVANAKQHADVSVEEVAIVYCFPIRCWHTSSGDTCRTDIQWFCNCVGDVLGMMGFCMGAMVKQSTGSEY